MSVRVSINSAELRNTLRRLNLSPVELVFLIAALAFAGIVAFFYFNQVRPLRGELAATINRQAELYNRLNRLSAEEKKRTEQTANAEKILDSLTRFETMLKPDERGMTQIINEIAALGKAHKVDIGDTGYRYAEAEEQQLDENGQPKVKSGEKKPQIYPALGIDTLVIGDYVNLRRFLADLERSRQFLIINALAFQGGDDKMMQALAKQGRQIELQGPGAIPVSVKIELDTYFQPPAGGGN